MTKEPFYLKTTESWALMDVDAPETQYFVQENASPRRVEITRPDEVKTVMLSHNAPGQWNDGLLFQEETYNPQGALLGKSFVQWEQGECPPPGQVAGPYQYCAPRPSRVETTDERGQTTGQEFSYGPRFNQVTETREYGYGYVFGGANTLLRRTVNQYPNDPNYIDKIQGVYWRHHYNLVTVNEVYAGDGSRLARTVYSYDQFTGAGGLIDTPGVVYTGHEIAWNPYSGAYNPATEFRGNITTIKRYADAETLDEETAVVETRHYDITGNVRKVETDCCAQTTINYTLSTQYAWPESQISGSPSDESNQNTGSVTYDFNTGLVETSKDANGRDSQTEYDPNTLRPVLEISPTFAYNQHIYDDVAMTVQDFAYEAGLDGPNFASRSDKSLDGRGRVIKQVSYGKAGVQDIVEVKYDQLGRPSQQSRPYRAGMTPLWSTVTYDFLDRPVQTIAPDTPNNSVVTRSYNQPDPPGSSGQPGQTINVSDPWGREQWVRSDALGHMVEVAEPDPGGNGTLSSGALFTTYAYDALGRLVEVNQGAQTRSFRYDSLGRLTHQKLAERDATLDDYENWVGAGQWSDVFTYDKRSNLTRHVDARGVKTIFKYEDAGGVEDPLNRLLEVEYDKSGSPPHLNINIPVAPKVNYAYMTTTPGDKRRVQNVFVDQGMGNETMSYDSFGRLSRVVQTFTGRESYPIVTDYIWDSLDRLKESAYPQQYGAGEIRKKVEPAYDAASQIESLKFGGATMASNPVYNAASQITSLKIGAKTFENFEYDPNTGLMTKQNVTSETTGILLDLKYNYTLNNDANNSGPKTGQLTGITDLKNQARNRAYEYDKLGRLAKVKGGVNAFTNPTWNQTYSYDRYGNRSLVQHTELAMSPVNPGSQSRSDLIGKTGPGAGGAANRIFSADEPFATPDINEGYGSVTANHSDSDNTGTPRRGGPRVTSEEYGNAPSSNGVGGELLAKHPAGVAPSAPQKKYGARRGLSIATPQITSVVTVYPGAYQTADPGQGGNAVSLPSNTGHDSTYIGMSVANFGGYSESKTSLWHSFPPVSGVTNITLKFNWSKTGNVSASTYFGEDYAEASADFGIEYSLNNGATWTSAVSSGHFASCPYIGFCDDSQPVDDGGSVSINIPASTPINQIRVRDKLFGQVSVSGERQSGSAASNFSVTVSSIRLEVEVADTTPPVISSVAAGGINLYSATITWTTNENSDSQVEYGTTAAYGQPTILNPLQVTAHSQGLFGLTPGTVYHYRVKSKDASGNLAVSGDYTFTTAPLVITNVVAEGITSFCVTITWDTNVPTDSQVEYGTTTAYGQWAPEVTPNPALVTSHSQYIPGLTPETVYHYRVRSKDTAGNLAISPDFSFTTGLLAITSVAVVGITTSSATINWTTSKPTDSQVAYGTTPAYGDFEPDPPNAELETSHSVVLTGLTAGTLYYYTIKSRDAGGNLAYCGGLTFTTAQSVPTDGLASLSYNDANNRITTPGFEYDPAGNQTRAVIDASGTQQQYRYDCANRLVQVLDGSGNVLATHAYGASNQRLMSVEGGAPTYFAWAGGQIIAEYEASGANALVWKTSYVYLGGRLLATTSGTDETGTRFHHPDRLGTRLVTATDGTVVSEQWTMPFGNMQPFTSVPGGENPYRNPTLSNPSKKRFTSYDRSDVTSLDYAVNRFYSPQQGRFTQVDPIGMSAASLSNPQTLNMYAYCGNDPINHVDPDGLFWGAIGRFFKAIGKAILSIFTSGGGAFSGPGFRTPPTFPGSLPGITAARRSGLGGFRTPPIVGGLNGFLAQQQAGQKQGWLDWYIDQWFKTLFGVDRKTFEENHRRALRRNAIKRQKEMCAANPEDCHKLDMLSDIQILELYDAWKDGKDSVTTEGLSINIITPGQPPSQPPLKPLHNEATLSKTSLEYWRKKSTDEITESLKPGKLETLRVKPNGTIMNGNTRIKVLQERGVDVNKLPREPYP